MRRAEGRFRDSTVYVTRQGTQVGRDGGRIVVREVSDEEELVSYPATEIETINVFGGVDVTTPLVATASDQGITINYFTTNGRFRGSFVPDRNTIAEVRRAQCTLEEERAHGIAEAIVRGKVLNARRFLARKGVQDVDLLVDLDARLDEATDRETLRGIEGDATRRYYAALDRTLAEGWSFEQRSRRPPEDDLNALLSLTYVVTTGEVRTALRRCNLDPFVGVYHADRQGTPSLALDLLEEFRPLFCDAFATRLVNRRTLDHDDFDTGHELRDEALRTYLEKFDDFMRETLTHPRLDRELTRREVIRQQAAHLRKVITGETEAYDPFGPDH